MTDSLRARIERGEPGDDLIELMARAYATDWDSADDRQRIWWRLKSLDVREAIEASGTHVVVPVEPTPEMVIAGRHATDPEVHLFLRDARSVYGSMIAARPRDATSPDPEPGDG